MRPSASDIIDGITWSLETYVAPDVSDPLARSAIRSTMNLLAHLRARLQDEAQVLWEDSREKRDLLAAVAELAGQIGGEAATTVAQAASRAEDVASAADSAPPAVDAMLVENESLKEALTTVIDTLEAGRDALGPAYSELDELVRSQLRRQLDRENRWIFSAFAGRPPF